MAKVEVTMPKMGESITESKPKPSTRYASTLDLSWARDSSTASRRWRDPSGPRPPPAERPALAIRPAYFDSGGSTL
jgi:hypothetical protein